MSKCGRLLLTHRWGERGCTIMQLCTDDLKLNIRALCSQRLFSGPGPWFSLLPGLHRPPRLLDPLPLSIHSSLLSSHLQIPLPLLPWTIKFPAPSPSQCIPAGSRGLSSHSYNVFLAKRTAKHKQFPLLRGIQLPECSPSPESSSSSIASRPCSWKWYYFLHWSKMFCGGSVGKRVWEIPG